MGHQNVSVLNGGLPEWEAKGFAIEDIAVKEYAHGNFKVNYDTGSFSDFDFITTKTITQISQVIDARSNGRFSGTANEPRKELQSGCILNSSNLPYTAVLNNGKYKSNDELNTLFHDLDLKNKPLVFSCGSGITACIILLAAKQVLTNTMSVYDGSWTEWAIKNELFT